MPTGTKASYHKERYIMTECLSLDGLNKAEVLAALYNASRTAGMGFLQYDPAPMTSAQAEEILAQTHYFDYLHGRVMKTDLSGDEFNPWGYDRDNGQGMAAQVLSILAETGDPNHQRIQDIHRASLETAVVETRSLLHEDPILNDEVVGNTRVVQMGGFGDVADVLGPAIDRATNR
jgi:hypothetical protein